MEKDRRNVISLLRDYIEKDSKEASCNDCFKSQSEFETVLQDKGDFILSLSSKKSKNIRLLEIRIESMKLEDAIDAKIEKVLPEDFDLTDFKVVFEESALYTLDAMVIDYSIRHRWEKLKQDVQLTGQHGSDGVGDPYEKLAFCHAMLFKIKNEHARINEFYLNEKQLLMSLARSGEDAVEDKRNLVMIIQMYLVRLQKIYSELEALIGQYELLILKERFDNGEKKNEILVKFCNRFINKYASYWEWNGIKAGNDKEVRGGGKTINSSKSLASLLGTSQFSLFVDGASQYFAERIKSEIEQSLIHKLREAFEEVKDADPAKLQQLRITVEQSSAHERASENKLSRMSLGLLVKLFPSTVEYICNLDPTRTASVVETLKEHVHSDLGQLLTNLGKLEQDPFLRILFRVDQSAENSENWHFLFTGLNLIQDVAKASHPYEILYSFSNNQIVKDNEPVQDFFEVLSFASEALLVKQGSGYVWVKMEFLRSSLGSSDFRDLYRALLGAKLMVEGVADTHNNESKRNEFLFRMAQELGQKSQGVKVKEVIAFIQSVSHRAEYLQNLISEMIAKKRDEGELSYKQVAAYFEGFVDLVEFSYSLYQVFEVKSGSTQSSKTVTRIFDSARRAGQLYQELNEKRYGAAISSALHLFTELPCKMNIGEERTAVILKMADFFVVLAEAESAEDVKEAIKSIAEPTGSAELKKHSMFYMGVGGYAGFHPIIAHQRDAEVSGASLGRLNFTVPVGFSFSFKMRFGGHRNNGGNGTLFLSLLDLGEPVSFYYQSDQDSSETAENINIDMSKLITPGISFMYDLPKIPISIGAGISFQFPDLDWEKRYWFVGPRLALDMPVIRLHRSKKEIWKK